MSKNGNDKRSFIGGRRATADGFVPQPTHDQQLSLSDAFEVFVQAKQAEGIRESTIKEYRHHIKYLTEFLAEEAEIKEATVYDVTPVLIRKYITYLLHEKPAYKGVSGRKKCSVGLSPNTVNIRLRTLKTMCRFWFFEGYVDFNAMASIKPVRIDEDDTERALSELEVNQVLNALDESQFAQWRDKVLILLLLDSGLRINEAVTLTIDRINFIHSEVTVPSNVAKNRKFREVPVSPEVLKELRQLHMESIGYFGKEGVGNQIFMNAYGDKFTPGAFRKRLNRLKKRIGMPTLHPHQFRHTFATDYLLNGGDIFSLQKILDHADIKTTRKYVHVNRDHIRQQHRRNTPIRKYIKRR